VTEVEGKRREQAESRLGAYRELFDAAETVRRICHQKGFEGIDECAANRRMELAQGKVAEAEGMRRYINMDGSVTLYAAGADSREVPAVEGQEPERTRQMRNDSPAITPNNPKKASENTRVLHGIFVDNE
jgi:hypothetical protein